MSKTVTHLDADQVLSSIRRLVAEKSVEQDVKGAESAALFLLTPAHRVPEPSPQQAETPTAPLDLADGPLVLVSEVAEPVEVPQEAPTNGRPIDARVAELEEVVGTAKSDVDEYEPDGSEPQDIHQPKLHFLRRYREMIDHEWTAAQERLANGELDHLIAEAAAEADDTAALEPLQLGAAYSDADTPEADEAPDEGQIAEFFRQRPLPSEQTENAQEPALDEPILVTSQPTPVPPEARPPEVPAAPIASALTTGELLADNDEVLVDEEMLRELVGEIVRAELQGRLGERITRNVRRMVRQEIERAIALRMLD